MSATGRKIIAAIRGLAAGRPGFVYTAPDDEEGACVYFYEGHPSCLVGQALANLQLIDARVEDRNWKVAQALASTPCRANESKASDLITNLGLELDISETDWINTVQELQDENVSWGTAVCQADENALIPA